MSMQDMREQLPNSLCTVLQIIATRVLPVVSHARGCAWFFFFFLFSYGAEIKNNLKIIDAKVPGDRGRSCVWMNKSE